MNLAVKEYFIGSEGAGGNLVDPRQGGQQSTRRSKPRTFVIGVGMTRFTRPGKEKKDYPDMAAEAANAALQHAGVDYSAVEAAVCGTVYSDSTAGQTCLYRLGLTGIPVVNVNNNCATGSTALDTARRFVQGGSGCVLALGFEKMSGNLKALFDDREHPSARHLKAMAETGISTERLLPEYSELTEAVLKVYAHGAMQHMKAHGTTVEQYAKVSHKNHKHSVNNPMAQIRAELPLEMILAAPTLLPPLTAAMAAPLASGAAAAVLCDEAFLEAHPELAPKAVEILAQAMTSDTPATFDTSDPAQCARNLCGYDLSRRAAQQVFEEACMGPEDVDVIEIHDAFSSNELITYEALGLCPPGKGGKMVDEAVWRVNSAGGEQCRMGPGGRWVINPSGGLESKGHPVGATGLAQCAELVWQLRGEAGKRQVDGAEVALQHNYGWSSAAVCTLYRAVRPVGRPGEAASKL